MGLEFAVQDLMENYYHCEVSEETPLENEAITFLSNYLEETPVYISVKIENEYAAFLIEMSENDYKNEILPYLKTLGDSTELNNTNIYETNRASITYIDGYFIAGSDAEYIGGLIEFATCTSNCENSLGENAEFRNIENEFLSSSAVDLYVTNISTLAETTIGMYDSAILNDSYIGAIEELGFSLKESSNTFTIATHVETNSADLKKLGYNFANTKKPTLYKKLPSGNVMFFQSATTAKSTVGALQSTEEYKQAIAEGIDDFDVDIDEILDALDDEVAFAIQDTGELLPSATLIAQLDSNESTIKELIDIGASTLWMNISNQAKWIEGNTVTDNKIIINDDPDLNMTITKNEVEIEGETLDQFEFALEFKGSKNPYAPKFSKADLTFLVTFGVTDGNFLFSTNKNIESEYGAGPNLSSTIKNKIDKNIDTISSIDITNIESYLEGVFEKMKKVVPTESDNFATAIWSVDTIAEPWGEIYATGKSTNSSTDSTIVIDFNTGVFAGDLLSGAYDGLFESSSDIIEILTNANTDFTDVKNGQWYADNIYYLTTHGIINGYEDGTFKPGNQVTRAEFITLLVRTLQSKGLMNSNYWYWGGATDYFTDIEEYSWYSKNISQALEVDIINSDNDTFRPGEAITRAEAAQMLANTIDFFGVAIYSATDFNFYDVNGSHWYANAVSIVNSNGIMTGKSTGRFAPFDKLTRAESAKILRTLIGNIEQF